MRIKFMALCLVASATVTASAGEGYFNTTSLMGCDSGCSTAGCDSACGCGSDSCFGGAVGPSGIGCSQSGFYLQTEALFFAPITNSSAQSYQVADAAGIIAPTASNLDADQLTFTPRVTLGRQFANGWGVQGRYWELNSFDGGGFGGLIVPAGATPNVNIIGGNQSVEAYTVDLELTKCLKFRDQYFQGFVGARHGALELSNSTTAFGQAVSPIFPDNYLLSALSQREFHGTGITYGFAGTKQLRCKQFSLYGGTRLSNLFGNNSGSATTSANVGSPLGTAFSTNFASDTTNDSLFIAESNLGLQWSRCIRPCRAACFARLGLEYQYWNANDVTATAFSTAAVTGRSAASIAATSNDLETHFIGFGFSTGFTF